ncbi:hypothetical protein CLI64_29535 (plasmid) [Nostoc sp. CENA543]|uniref:hypothetical protein n=1 Tax=Nostoc sp. CENA543 TaxID=1869241 RepID=UPI000CA3D149|nr:hypothetical protein [Nostoc sp. CENA543]AUT04585.1 hypothetical protein CLI64_29535 [Nostoc sp. CENA543]
MEKKEPRLMIAFPKSETELRVVFSEAVDRKSAENPLNYRTRSGMKIFAAHVDPNDPQRVSLVTEPMNGEAMEVDVLQAPGVETRDGRKLVHHDSPEFIQGIASIPEIQRPAINEFPFPSRFVGKVASASCGKDGGVDSNVLINTFGFAFIHMQNGGPFNSLKIVTKQHILGIAEATRVLRAGQTVHVLWAGGEIRNVDGENQLVDTGYMEGSIIAPTPLKSPPPFPLRTDEIADKASRSLRATALQGVVVQFEDVIIDRLLPSNPDGLRTIWFHNDTDEQLPAVLLDNVTTVLSVGQRLKYLRGIVHQPRAGEYEVIVELDQHLVLSDTEIFGHVTLIEGYDLPDFQGCHALINLRDTPGKIVAVLTSEYKLQSLLETAFQTGALIAFWGEYLNEPPTPRGGSWAVNVYQINGVIVYDRP